MRRRRPPPINQTITPTSELSMKISEVSKIENKVITHPDFITPVKSVNSPSTEAINRKSMIENIPFYPDPTYRPSPMLIRIPKQEGQENIDISPEIDIGFKENSLFLEGVSSETYQRPDKSLFQEPQELESLVNKAIWYLNFYQNKLISIRYKRNNTKKSTQRYTFACCNKRNTGRILSQPLL